MVKNISILGSTGSIGTKALKIAEQLNIKVDGLAIFNNIALLEDQIKRFHPKVVAVFDTPSADKLREKLKNNYTKILSGLDGLCEVATLNSVDMVLNSVSGMIGLKPTLLAIESRKNIALANKETLVAGGELVMRSAKDHGVQIFPVDSEHSAIFQCLYGYQDRNSIKKLILTASGGPFRGKNKIFLKNVTKKDALKHPNWNMGTKITIDSATMMNKGLEIIEAAWLFDMAPDDIEVLVHKESIVHSMVEFNDNSILAQMAVPDMGIPIQFAFTYPNHTPSIVDRLNLAKVGTLTFEKPDTEVFLGIDICRKALKMGGAMPAIINGANEEAVKMFLNDEISFLEIENVVKKALFSFEVCKIRSFDDIIYMDALARNFVKENAVRREV